MSSLCQKCSSANLQRTDFLRPAFVDSSTDDEDDETDEEKPAVLSGRLGNLRISQATCPSCRVIFHAIQKSFPEELARASDDLSWHSRWSYSTSDFAPDSSYEDEDIYAKYTSALYPCLGEGDSNKVYGIQLIDDRDTDGFLRGRVVTDEIDIGMIRGWIDKCARLHGQDCATTMLERRPLSATALLELIVIDVQELCLTSLPKGAEYVALSYVWGETNQPVTVEANRTQFSAPGGLDITLPKSIADVIGVTNALGFRYLWVDSLCIVQDDFKFKQLSINNMDAVYGNAALTLVAATGSHADAGLSGWSSREGRDQHLVQLGENCRVGILPYYQHELLNCEHSSRAWTFQETCLSPRCLIFLNGFVYFNCNAAVYAEHTHAEVDGVLPEQSANTLGKQTKEETWLEQYSSCLLTYTDRQLKYQSDIIAAFAGIAAAFSRPMGVSSLFFGIPASCFDWAILWHGLESLTPREDLPSWSWLGWKGRALMPYDVDTVQSQIWLREGTWIDWYSVQDDDTCRPLWDSRRDDCFASPIIAEDAADESEEGSESEEFEASPTYGDSTLKNVYGRSSRPAALELIPIRPTNFNIYTTCNITHPGTLCFAAPTVTLSMPLPSSSSSSGLTQPLRITDRNGSTCGSVLLCTGAASACSTETPAKVKFLLLSSLYDGFLSLHMYSPSSPIFDIPGIDREELMEYLERPPGAWNRFDFVNVLMVQEAGRMAEGKKGDGNHFSCGVYRREGVGVLYRVALRTMDVAWEDVVLV